MKRGFALIGAAILLLLLIGCAHGEPTQPVHESTEQQPIDTPVTIEGLRWLSDQPSEQPDFPNRGVYIAYAVNNEKAGSIAGDTMQQIKGGKGMNGMMKYMMMSEMMKGNGGNNNSMSSMLPMMMFMNGGMGDMFEGMFDFDEEEDEKEEK